MLNQEIDWDLAKQEYAHKGYTRIENVLEADYASRIANALTNETDWRLCYRDEDGPVCLTRMEVQTYTPQQQAELNRKILARAQAGFSYYYYRYSLANDPNEQLKDFLNKVREEKTLGFIRYVTGQAAIKTATGQATCYRPSCFLRQHDDSHSSEHRIVAYVFGFTPVWQADWGGLLNIQDETSKVIATQTPAFNTLTLIKVPTLHFVSQVAGYARGVRYTTTGWFLAP